MIANNIIAFTVTAALLTVTPGIDTALVLRTAAAEGSRPAMFAAFGIALGCFGWGLLTAVGFGALLSASETAYAALRWLGAAYLVYLGIKMLGASRCQLDASPAFAPAYSVSSLRWFLRGFLTNALNPKVGIFYVSFLPQFIPAHADVAAYVVFLTAIHLVLSIMWFAVLIQATRPLARLFRKPGFVATLDRVTGGVFVALGVRLALSDSH